MIILISMSVLSVIIMYPLFISASVLDKMAERRNNKKYKPVDLYYMIKGYVHMVRYK